MAEDGDVEVVDVATERSVGEGLERPLKQGTSNAGEV